MKHECYSEVSRLLHGDLASILNIHIQQVSSILANICRSFCSAYKFLALCYLKPKLPISNYAPEHIFDPPMQVVEYADSNGQGEAAYNAVAIYKQ